MFQLKGLTLQQHWEDQASFMDKPHGIEIKS